MRSKRLRSSTSPGDRGRSSSSDQGPSKRTHADSASPLPDACDSEGSADRYPLRVHIISAKLSSGVLGDLIRLVEGNTVRRLELTIDPDNADVIVTGIHTRPRLERHVSWEVAKTKAIVTLDWLRDSADSGTIQPCGKYAALGGLRDYTESRCLKAKTDEPSPLEASRNYHAQFPIFTDPEIVTKDADRKALNHLSHLCCQRASPLTCPNQALAEELEIIRRARFYEGEERSMLSYARAIATIKGWPKKSLQHSENLPGDLAHPYPFNDRTTQETLAKLPYFGTKLTSMVEEFIKTGEVQEARKILSSRRFLSLRTFNSIHGIGPHTARSLYSLGLRSIEDLERYYEVTSGITDEGNALGPEEVTSSEISVDKSIKVALALRRDFSQKIPRQEVEEINQVIMRELELIEPGCKSLVAGGYRRGKPESNDVDIVISHTDWDHGADKVRGLCKKLVQRLHERGLITHVLNMSGYHPHNVFRLHHLDSFEKALTVFVLPDDSARNRIYRRVDLIFATPGVFWTAIVGWTGSTMFQRDLRLWAKQAKGFKFDSSGITRRHDSKLFHPKSEREVFELLGLAYVHPTLRNADA